MFFNIKRVSSSEFLSVVVIFALGIPHLKAHTICTPGLTAIGLKLEYAEKLKRIHSSFLDPEVAQLATDLRRAWIRALLDPKQNPHPFNVILSRELSDSVIEVLNRGIESREALISKLKISKMDSMHNGVLPNLEAMKSIKLELQKSMLVKYSDFQNILNLIIQPYDHELKYAQNTSEDFYLRDEFFKVTVPLLTDRIGHLGFRKLNDWDAVAIIPVEFPRIDAQLNVDGTTYDFRSFVSHDVGHGNSQYSQLIRDSLLRIAQVPKNNFFSDYNSINSLSDSEFVSLFMKHLEERVERYTKIRKYIDSIQDRKKRILAEGYWFYFTHELNIGFSEQSVIDDTLRNYRNFGVTRFDSFDDFALSRFRSRGDLGQAFKDPSWITTKDLKEIRKGFEFATGLRFNI
ncbi:MAG: hypothetical protein KA116_04540 [Proteobacteria bacterium]|nr:hypothetical protein [Pseudomonadota bacterium]